MKFSFLITPFKNVFIPRHGISLATVPFLDFVMIHLGKSQCVLRCNKTIFRIKIIFMIYHVGMLTSCVLLSVYRFLSHREDKPMEEISRIF